MLQQTPVARVAAGLARVAGPLADAGRPGRRRPRRGGPAWGRLGYPRRALRLHAAAPASCAARRRVPADSSPSCCALPGVGDYTAAAVAAFAFRQRHPVLDTNVRRVLARAGAGRAFEPAGAPTAAERDAGRPAAARRRRDGGHLGRRGDGARRPGLHGPLTALRRLPGGRCAPGGRPAPRRGTARPDAVRRTPAPTARSAGRLLAVLRDRPAGAAVGAGRGLHEPAQRARRWTGWSPTASWSRSRTAGSTGCPAEGSCTGQRTRRTVPGGGGRTASGCRIAAIVSTPSTSRGPGRTTMPSASMAHIGTSPAAARRPTGLIGGTVEVESAGRHDDHFRSAPRCGPARPRIERRPVAPPARRRPPAPGRAPNGRRERRVDPLDYRHPRLGPTGYRGRDRVQPMPSPADQRVSPRPVTPVRSPTSSMLASTSSSECGSSGQHVGLGSRGSPAHRRPGPTGGRTPGRGPG